jgi:hypothetical protein
MTPICERIVCCGCGSVISTPKCPKCGTDNEPAPVWPADADDKRVREVGP